MCRLTAGTLPPVVAKNSLCCRDTSIIIKILLKLTVESPMARLLNPLSATAREPIACENR